MVPLDQLKEINDSEANAGSQDETTPPDDAQGGSDDENGNEPDDTPKTPTNAPETPTEESAENEADTARKKLGNAKADDYDRKSFKSFVFKKGWAEDMVDWAGYKSQFAKDIQTILEAIVAEIGQAEFERLIGLDGTFDAHTREIEKYLKENAKQNSIEVNDETEKQIKATLKEGITANEDVNKLKARVSNVFGTASSQRAMRIALTEASMAMNYADVQAWKQSDVVEAKEWFTAEDASVCGWCKELDGKRIGLDENFFEKGDTLSYTDLKGHEHTMKLDYRTMGEPPLHPECRCVLLPIM